jgi:mono/diheme cytochrome c family protein
MSDFTTPDLARATTPTHWFSIITDGNIDRVMPPWREKLTETERWNLVAYLYSLSAPQIETGWQTYAANCANCHGANGQGDGKDAAAPIPDFTDQKYMASKSDDDFYAAITQGLNGAHAYADTLTGDERRAVSDLVRSFSFDTTALAVSSGTVTGTLTNGTPGASAPDGQAVVLHLFDNFQETDAITTTTQSGMFEFADVAFPPGRALILSVDYGGVIYVSDVASPVAGQTTYDLPVQVFESTSDPSAIGVDRMHIILEFQADRVQVAELFILGNNGDATFAAAAPDAPTVSFALPAGYGDLAFQDGAIGDRYRQTADGFADTDIDHDLLQPRHLHHVLVVKLFLESRGDFAQVFLFQAKWDLLERLVGFRSTHIDRALGSPFLFRLPLLFRFLGHLLPPAGTSWCSGISRQKLGLKDLGGQ